MTEKKENPTRNQPLLYSGVLLSTYYNRMLFAERNFLYSKKYKQLNSIVKNQEIVVKTKLD